MKEKMIKSNPIEVFHGMLMESFHEFRKELFGKKVVVEMDGIDFSQIIAKAKLNLYKNYPETEEIMIQLISKN